MGPSSSGDAAAGGMATAGGGGPKETPAWLGIAFLSFFKAYLEMEDLFAAHSSFCSQPWSSGTTPLLVSPQRPRSHAQCTKQALGDLCTLRSPPKGSAGSNFGFSSESC
jgi:hypothetical protein